VGSVVGQESACEVACGNRRPRPRPSRCAAGDMQRSRRATASSRSRRSANFNARLASEYCEMFFDGTPNPGLHEIRSKNSSSLIDDRSARLRLFVHALDRRSPAEPDASLSIASRLAVTTAVTEWSPASSSAVKVSSACEQGPVCGGAHAKSLCHIQYRLKPFA